ncbi:hypothetical protein E0500_031950 [Streptomyces sp. KM273126]|uniref:hypothetical protein n=1 Tax=Streptomyces sp. KM273126 TaxID=2545247 RepID=UPI001038926B|nr:hypothetical protein [Streptomyces sp. KM273126]MBA2811809.1 hypothetical protein [Streptomyces sp. KM273126]
MALASCALLLALAGYAVLCFVRPFAPCRKCSGTGIRQTGRRTVKLCRRCHGRRYRLRAGRRLLNTGRAVHHAGTRRPHPRRLNDRGFSQWP